MLFIYAQLNTSCTDNLEAIAKYFKLLASLDFVTNSLENVKSSTCTQKIIKCIMLPNWVESFPIECQHFLLSSMKWIMYENNITQSCWRKSWYFKKLSLSPLHRIILRVNPSCSTRIVPCTDVIFVYFGDTWSSLNLWDTSVSYLFLLMKQEQ